MPERREARPRGRCTAARLLVGLALIAAAQRSRVGVAARLADRPAQPGAGHAADAVGLAAVGVRRHASSAPGRSPAGRCRRTLRSLPLLFPLVTRALPLLLLFITFLFINAEVWQVSATLDGGVLWLTVLLFAALAVVFLLARLPEELDQVDDEVEVDQIVGSCRGHPAGGVRRVAGPRDDPEHGPNRTLTDDTQMHGLEKANLVLVLMVAQAVQVLLLAVSVFAFFMVFGGLVMTHGVQEAWIGEDAVTRCRGPTTSPSSCSRSRSSSRPSPASTSPSTPSPTRPTATSSSPRSRPSSTAPSASRAVYLAARAADRAAQPAQRGASFTASVTPVPPGSRSARRRGPVATSRPLAGDPVDDVGRGRGRGRAAPRAGTCGGPVGDVVGAEHRAQRVPPRRRAARRGRAGRAPRRRPRRAGGAAPRRAATSVPQVGAGCRASSGGVRPRHPRPVHPPVVLARARAPSAQSGSLSRPSSSPIQITGSPPKPSTSACASRIRCRARRVADLEPGQRGQRPGDAPVAGGRVLLEDQPAGPGAGELAGVEVGEERAVAEAGHPDRRGVVVVDRPADVVVAARVGDPGGRRRRGRQLLQRAGGEPRVAAGEHRPDLHHQAVVVGQVADLAVVLALRRGRPPGPAARRSPRP